ncbi:MAG: hypothetical protein ACK5MT_04435 [Actinomycetales bacterium]
MVASARGISVVCVFNDAAVLSECLQASVEGYRGDIDVQFIPVDNREHTFSSAGSALNHGARQARHPLVAFVHQDVYIHSFERLLEAEAELHAGWGLIGANGVRHDGTNCGRIRDRVQIIGTPAPTPVEVDSVDEVLFLTTRQQILDHPLSEDPELSWHAYAVELGLRLRRTGQRIGVADLGVTHNSLTTNLAKLDLAHRHVGDLYREFLPVRTTCGTIQARGRTTSLLATARRVARPLRRLQSRVSAAGVRARTGLAVIDSDIRHEVDLLPYSPARPLHLINIDPAEEFARYAPGTLSVTRYGNPVMMTAVSSLSQCRKALSTIPPTAIVLVVGLEPHHYGDLPELLDRDRGWMLGRHPGSVWLVGGLGRADLPHDWAQRCVVTGRNFR